MLKRYVFSENMDRLFCYHAEKTRNSTRGILQLRFQFDYPDEIGTPRSKSNALQLVFKDPAQGFVTSLLSADQSRTLDFELEAPANASKFMEDPLPVFSGRTQKKVLGETALSRESIEASRTMPRDLHPKTQHRNQ